MSMHVKGGFFWLRRDPFGDFPLEERFTPTQPGVDMMAECVFWVRPRWYEMRKWYRAWRRWLRLPEQ